MAAAQQQMQGLVDNQLSQPTVKWASKPLFGDVPTHDGNVRLEQALSWLHSISRGGSSIGANVLRTDPGAGGGGNATVQAQHTDRCQCSREACLSLIEPQSQLYATCNTAIFAGGAEIWDWLTSPNIVYLRIADDVAQEEIRKVQLLTVKDLPVDKQDEMQVLHFKALIQGYNPMKHPNMNITNQMKITIFCNGLHPEAKIIALNMKNDLVAAAAAGCCFPANHPAGHPQAGIAHPQAGQLSLDALAMYTHRSFSMKVRAGLVRLNVRPGAAQLATSNDDGQLAATDVASELPVPSQDAYAYASWDDLRDHNYDNFHEYAMYVLNREASQLRTCRNCGGVGHFAEKDGVLVCATERGSVPVDLLRRIKYPFGVRAWRFGSGKGKGRGKGKGIGKGKGGASNGRGRGGYWAWHDPEPPAASDDAALNTDGATDVQYITDDFDGWNVWNPDS